MANSLAEDGNFIMRHNLFSDDGNCTITVADTHRIPQTLWQPMDAFVSEYDLHLQVYSIPSAECIRRYIGQTTQEHCCALKKRDVAASAVAEHAFSCNNKVNLSKASVIDTHSHTQAHCILECWHIQHNPASLNIRSC